MENQTVARVYARALYPLLKDSFTDSIYTIDAVSEALNSSEQARIFINHPVINAEKKLEFMTGLCCKNISEPLKNFFSILLEKKRMPALDAIIEELEKEFALHNKMKFVEVVTAQPISKEEAETMSKAIAAWLERKIEVEFLVDPSKIAGFVIKFDDTVIDNSVHTELKNMKEYLLSAGEKA